MGERSGLDRAKIVRRGLWAGWRNLCAAVPLSLCLGEAYAAALPELSAGQQQLLLSTGEEKPYNVRLHFLKSNERRHDLFFSVLSRLGGGYLGVGADQNYTLAAVANAELVFLVDIDGEVIRWHKIYAALIPVAPSPQDLLKLLQARADAQAKEALEQRWPTEAAELLQSYRNYRHMLGIHLQNEMQVRHNGRPSTWISDPVLYARIRALMIARRVIARVGDLHGERTMLSIGDAAHALHVTIRTVYLSNVEQWFGRVYRLACVPHVLPFSVGNFRSCLNRYTSVGLEVVDHSWTTCKRGCDG